MTAEKALDFETIGKFSQLESLHLHRLMASWSLIADLSFSDLLLYVPDRNQLSSTGLPKYYSVVGQIRPFTTQTIFAQDLVGSVYSSDEVPLVEQCLVSGVIIEGKAETQQGNLKLIYVPVAYKANSDSKQILAVLVRASKEHLERKKGELEENYNHLATLLSEMIANGDFPFSQDEATIEEAPRVGDGVMILDKQMRVKYASPNAQSALHRLGIRQNINGKTFKEVGLNIEELYLIKSNKTPTIKEIENTNQRVVSFRFIPLISANKMQELMVLVRDVSELRRRERELLSKDAAIREVHHRVKNNLQTISSLLSLQARRISSKEGKMALKEAERRVRSIAVVHEILSRDTSEGVSFDEIASAIIRLAKDAQLPSQKVRIVLKGNAGAVKSEIATALSIALAELIQNAIEHAFKDKTKEVPTITVEIFQEGNELILRVIDNGSGLPENFNLEKTDSLGLLLVRSLVKTQLDGELSFKNAEPGTIAEIRVPNYFNTR
jgi:two-component sensor histidine kinase